MSGRGEMILPPGRHKRKTVHPKIKVSVFVMKIVKFISKVKLTLGKYDSL